MKQLGMCLLDNNFFSCSIGLQLWLLLRGLLSGGLAPPAAVATAAFGPPHVALALLMLFICLHERSGGLTDRTAAALSCLLASCSCLLLPLLYAKRITQCLAWLASRPLMLCL